VAGAEERGVRLAALLGAASVQLARRRKKRDDTAATRELVAPLLGELELVDFSVGDDPKARGRIALPVSADTGSTGTVVYLEVDPDNRIPLHTHTAEETLVVLQGTGVATAGDQQGLVSVGAIIVVPAFAPHGFENTGSDTLKLVGFFGSGVVINYFDEPVAPFGVRTFVTPILP
jgi:quercetin dioxygenase-like cupin family protein